MERLSYLWGGVLGGVFFVGLLTLVLPDGKLAYFLLDINTKILPYPLTIQNLTWVIFFISLGDILSRYHSALADENQLGLGLLPEDKKSMLRTNDLVPIYRELDKRPEDRNRFLNQMIKRIILQFQSSGSIDQCHSFLNANFDLFQHSIDMRYNFLRYAVWLIPTLGFIGTIIGIALALETAGNIPDVADSTQLKPWMKSLTGALGVAFNTTLLSLILSAILVWLMSFVQEKEELALNHSTQYCWDNLINRLYEK